MIRTDSLDIISDDEIQQCLSDQFLSKAYQLLKKDEKPLPVRAVFLMFEIATVLTHIYVGYEKVHI